MNLFVTSILLFLASLGISFGLLRCIEKLWKKWSILDRPHLYKSEHGRDPVPYSAGVILFGILAIFSPLIFIFGDLSPLLEKRLAIMLTIGGIITLVSFLDDMETIDKSPLRIPPIVRLIMQVSVGAIIGLTSIKISYISHIFGGITRLDDLFFHFALGNWDITIYYFPLLVTIFWYVVVFNAVNFSDGIPGLTGGFSLITFIIFAGLALKLYLTDTSEASQENSRFLLMLLAVIIPATFVLTRADIARRVIMGDSGTIMLGFLIATFAIIAGGKIATAIAVLGVYLIDFIYVVMSRILQGKNPMKGDQSLHLHFRLLELGLTKGQIRVIIYGLTAFFGVSAIFLNTEGKIILIGFIAFVSIFLTEILSVVRKK